jgi:CO/xanthine dehydrogenase Mo-binding subunit
MLHGAVLRSPLAHGAIGAVETAAAQAMPGVATVLSGHDLDGACYGHAIKDRPILATDRVRFAGEPVAAVAAESRAAAEAALAAIDVTYEPLPVAGTIEEALAANAPLVHEKPAAPGLFHGVGTLPDREGNTAYRQELAAGDLAAVRAGAHITVNGEYSFPAVYQYAMETHTVVADWPGGELTLWASCQHPFLVRAEIADLFGLPLEAVRVIVPYVGGGFGSKSYTKMEPIAAALARRAARPVRLQNRVDESMVTTRRHGMRCWMRTAAGADGTLLAREARFFLDTGAYADNGPRVAATAVDAAPGPYAWSAVRVEGSCVYSNTSPAGSYRGFGAAHLQWIGELQVDEVARRAGVDPLEVRRRNLLRPGRRVRPDGTGRPLDADLVGDVEQAAAALDWQRPREQGRGRGVSVGLLGAGAQPVSGAFVRRCRDGTFEVGVGTTEVGQGARTIMAQLAAAELGVDVDRVRMRGTDTGVTPFDRSTGASRSTTVAGTAVQRAAAAMARRLRRSAPEAGEELVEVGEVRSAEEDPSPVFWEVCVAGAEVEVEPDTGVVRVLRTVTVADVGKAINPELVARQHEGAAIQGLGNALFEEMIYEGGRLLNDSLLEYRVPRAQDIPQDMVSLIVENSDGPGPHGAKGCGEGAMPAVVAAIACAAADAGVPVTELPLTPERVWRSLKAVEGEGPER